MEPVIVVHTSLCMQALCTCNNLCTRSKTIIYGIVMNIGVTKHMWLLWICYVYLVMVWSIHGLVHVQLEIVLRSMRLGVDRTTLCIILASAALECISCHAVIEWLHVIQIR